MFLFNLAVFVVVVVSSATTTATSIVASSSTVDSFTRYHDDSSCYIDEYHTNKDLLVNLRADIHSTLREVGSINHITNQKTKICPITPPALSSTNTISNQETKLSPIGLDTVWIVENHASTPIVIAWIDPATGIEYAAGSAATKLNAVPSTDPLSILQPGESTVIDTHEGQVFNARALLNGTIIGPILLRHTIGLIPVGNPSTIYQCNSEGSTTATSHDDNNVEQSTLESDDDNDHMVDYSFNQRHEATVLPKCNTLETGFRNMINCPVNGYFVNKDESEEQELERFHLGIQSSNLDDFMHDYESTTKYESTYIGHTFRFRLVANPNIIVDTITIEPTIVRDCPAMAERVSIRAMVGNEQTVSVVPSFSNLYIPLYSHQQFQNDSQTISERITSVTLVKGSTSYISSKAI